MPSIALPVSLRGQLLNTSFDPSRISAGSTAFLWLDPSDLTTMFQDAAGTTPVTAPAQPVGLVLDKSQGLVLGPELVTNGDFSNGTTGWTLEAGWSVSGGTASRTNSASTSAISQTASIVAGRFYQVSFDLVSIAGGAIRVNLGSTSQLAEFATAGPKTCIVQAQASNSVFYLRGSSTFEGTIDNISVRELPGFHATQSTAANRPTYGVVPSRGRVNLLTRTEEFGNAAWVKGSTTVSQNTTVAPDGTMTADKVVATAVSGFHNVYQNVTGTVAAYVFSVYAKAAEYSKLQLANASEGTWSATFDLATGATIATGGAAVLSSSVQSVGDGWYRCSVTFTGAAAFTAHSIVGYPNSGATLNNFGVSYTGDGTSGILIWGAQLELGSTASPYQRVVSQFEVTDPAGFPSYPLHYLFFGGDLDPRWLQTSTITPSADKVQVFAGVRKLSDAASGIVAELSTSRLTNNGAFNLASGTPGYQFNSRGTIDSFAVIGGYPSPVTHVLSGLGDISADIATLRVNGAQVVQSTTDQGTGNYLAYPIFIGRRGGTSLAFNGNLYGLIVRFSTANLDASVIAQTERWMAYKTGVTI